MTTNEKALKKRKIMQETRARFDTQHQTGGLGDGELLGLLLNDVKAGHNVLAHFGFDLREVSRATVAELTLVSGVGERTAYVIKAALELGLRAGQARRKENPQVTCPEDAVALMAPVMRDQPQEHLRILCLDTRNRMICDQLAYIGNVNSSIVRPAELLKPAVMRNATSIMLFHNHPSGEPTPSPEDIAVTKQVKEAAELMGFELLDHIIIGADSFTSLKGRGLM